MWAHARSSTIYRKAGQMVKSPPVCDIRHLLSDWGVDFENSCLRFLGTCCGQLIIGVPEQYATLTGHISTD